jgi:hypothetical protein
MRCIVAFIGKLGTAGVARHKGMDGKCKFRGRACASDSHPVLGRHRIRGYPLAHCQGAALYSPL